MKLLALISPIAFGLCGALVCACNTVQTGNKLTQNDIDYISALGILNKQEKIILFETHSGWFNGKRLSGNYFTDKRIAGYWIDKRTQKQTINSAFYQDIDTITTTDLSRSLTMASYLTVKKKDGQAFNIFISLNSAETAAFFSSAISEWQKHN
jgi:hypothetical protein